MRASANLRLPGYLPAGYKLWTVIQGSDAGGFGFVSSDDQYAATYLRDKMPAGNATVLTVFKAPPGRRTLGATDDRRGEEVDLGIVGIKAIYHDGMWLFGPGNEQRLVKGVVFHWSRSAGHSITVGSTTEVWGIRGPNNAVVDKDQLMEIGRSLVIQ